MEDRASRRIHLKNWLAIIVVVILYSFTGFLGLSFLSTPPGFATPIWIPSGIALGAAIIWGLRILPGIFLGSLILNYYVSTRLNINIASYTPLVIGSIIGCGAVLQTAFGWFMIKKWIGLKNRLNSPIDILLFAFLSGPVSCLVNTTWSNTFLLLFKIISPDTYFFTWGTWWIGDSIGVLIFTPLFLILFAKPHSIWRQRIIPILIPLCLSFIGVIIIYHIASASGFTQQLWAVLISGLLFCVLINVILFIVNGQINLVQMRMNKQAKILKFEEIKNFLILNSAGEGIFGVDTNGNITFINAAATKMLGYSSKELIGKSIHALVQYQDINGNKFPQEKSAIYAAFKNKQTSHIRNEIFWRKDKTFFWVDYTSTPLINHDKNIGAVIVFNDMTQQMETESMLQKMAHYDALTGLPNRTSFLEKLSRALEYAKQNQRVMAVCFIDIDNFKQINDSLGHTVGDEILKKIPKLLEPELTKMGFIARFGGDEFAVIIENVISIDYIKLTLQRFIKILQQPLRIDHHEILVSLSIGIATYPASGDTETTLIKNADSAMYKAKELGKNTFAFFDEEINRRMLRVQDIEIEMPKAVGGGEFSIYYQPLVDSKTIQLLGFEILLRWNSPILGEVAPAEFISIAEKNGLIHEIGEWVLAKACAEYNKITTIFNDKNLLLSINISILQLENEDFFAKIKNIICDSEMNSNNLIFEITESELMQQPERTIELIKEIKKLGIRFALDDFGVSHSSMQYLKILPISLLKIDKVFIRDIVVDSNDASIVRAIIQLAHGLGISTIAEGVETKEQFMLLKEMGCEYIQGFYFLEPMPIHRLSPSDLLKGGWL